jgi:error-prone DNA polymerase
MYPKRVIVADARLAGIAVLGADVNACTGDWRVEHAGRPPAAALRPGLHDVKGISDAEVAGIVAGQPYTSLRDFFERAGVSRPVTERLVLVGAFDGLYPPRTGVSRRDLLARVGVLHRARPPHITVSAGTKQPKPGARPAQNHEKTPLRGAQMPLTPDGPEGLDAVVPAGELRELTAAERVEAELEILGIDLSQHVLGFYTAVLAELGVVRSADLHRCRAGEKVLVAGVKVATQTPAVRSGQRIIFATLDDATGPVDLAFFESVQDRCAARLFGSWLLVAEGRVRRAGHSVSLTGERCWDLAALADIRAASGPAGLRAAMATGDAPGAGRAAGDAPGSSPKIIYPNGFALSPYAESGSPGGAVKDAPRQLWHASPGSAGGGRAVPGAGP